MGELKDRIIRLIEQQAAKKVSELSGEFARADSDDKEQILAAMDIERWLADSCSECLN